MKTSSHFNSKNSALVLGTVLTASTLFAGFTLAQQWLSIPTDLTNAVITIQRILLSTNGVSTTLSPDQAVTLGEASISLDGANGSITTRWNTSDLTVGWTVRFQKSDYKCWVASGTSWSTECILKVDTAGRVSITDQFSGASNDDNIFKRTAGDDTNIFLAKNDGSESEVGNNPITQSVLRVGATTNNIDPTDRPTKPDTAMIVAGTVESRGGLLIRKLNNTPLGNAGNNLKAKIDDEEYTELDMNTTAGTVNMASAYKNWGYQDTSFKFSAEGAKTRVGVNMAGNMDANLQVGQDGTFLVGEMGCFIADTLVTLADGTTKDIQDVKIGDKLKAVDGVNTVVSLLRPKLGKQSVYAINNKDSFFTANHPFLTTKWWKSLDPETTKKEIPELEVSKLKIGDILITEAGKVLVVSLTPATMPTSTQLYNFELDGDHTYFANGYAVHNKVDCTPYGAGLCPNNNGGALYADDATEKVGIHTTAPQKTLDVNGDAVVRDSLIVGHLPDFDPGTDKLAINGNTRANAYYYNSDRRYKSDIVALKSPLENLLKISGYHYYSKLEKKDTLGVIAQEVEAVYPELVQTDSQWYKSVQYGNLVAPIIEAIRELSTKIDNLFTLYVSQQAKIDTLEARLLKLEAQLK